TFSSKPRSLVATMLSNRLPFYKFHVNISEFLRDFIEQKQQLTLLATKLTKTSHAYHLADHAHAVEVMEYLLHSEVQAERNILFRPKGRVLIGLSANEPLIVSVVPIVAALLAGNSVVVRPSSKTAEFTA